MSLIDWRNIFRDREKHEAERRGEQKGEQRGLDLAAQAVRDLRPGETPEQAIDRLRESGRS